MYYVAVSGEIEPFDCAVMLYGVALHFHFLGALIPVKKVNSSLMVSNSKDSLIRRQFNYTDLLLAYSLDQTRPKFVIQDNYSPIFAAHNSFSCFGNSD